MVLCVKEDKLQTVQGEFCGKVMSTMSISIAAVDKNFIKPKNVVFRAPNELKLYFNNNNNNNNNKESSSSSSPPPLPPSLLINTNKEEESTVACCIESFQEAQDIFQIVDVLVVPPEPDLWIELLKQKRAAEEAEAEK